MESPLGLGDVCARIGKTPGELRDFFAVTDAAISQWKADGFPPARAIEIERAFPGRVKAAEIKTVQRKPRKKSPEKRRAA